MGRKSKNQKVLERIILNAGKPDFITPFYEEDDSVLALVYTGRHKHCKSHSRKGLRNLTAREYNILLLLANGHTQSEIKKRYFISQTVMGLTVRGIVGKMNARNLNNAIYIACRNKGFSKKGLTNERA